MNERIQELACEAEDYADGIVDQGGEFHQAYTQRLVELIVQECAKVCLEQRNPANLNYKPSEHFAEAVKQHFGVES